MSSRIISRVSAPASTSPHAPAPAAPMLIRILYFIFLLVFIRFIVRLARELMRPSPPPKRDPRAGTDDPLRGRRVIDVDYEDMKPGGEPGKGAR